MCGSRRSPRRRATEVLPVRCLEWRSLLRSCPAARIRLRPGASRRALASCERRLGGTFPTVYRNFLRVSDGAWIGPQRLYGTKELSAWLDGQAAGRLRRPGRAPTTPRQVFVPIAPLGRRALECLELESGGIHAFEREQAFVASEGILLYADFVDWALDAFWDLHFESDGQLLRC